MKLSEKQALFTLNIAKLVVFAWQKGYRLTYGEAWRPPEMAKLNAKSGKGIANSLHTIRLAVDFNLFRDGVFLSKTEDHAELGEHWKALHPLNRWGGDFKSRPDGNHYSMEHNGVQ